MADNTAIEWTSATWNPIAGCSVLSPGCTHCYAMGMAARIEKMQAAQGKPTHYAGLTQPSKAGPVWNGRIAVAPDEVLTQPLRWKRPRRIFVNSMSDLFHEGVADETIDKVFAVMALCPQHTFQVLTKRAPRMRAYIAARLPDHHREAWAAAYEPGTLPMTQHQVEAWLLPVTTDSHRTLYRASLVKFPLPNVWLGVSTEDQARADERIPHLLATPAAKRFISAEPLLGEIKLFYVKEDFGPVHDALAGETWYQGAGSINSRTVTGKPKLDWVIAGGESGPKARPSHPDWFRSLRDQCAAAGVPFFFKQWGEWEPREEWSGHLGGGRFETMLAIMRDGSQCPHDVVPQDVGAQRMALVGKKAAGAKLDGREHREFPR